MAGEAYADKFNGFNPDGFFRTHNSKALEFNRLKASRSFVDVFVVSPLEIIENLVKINWSKIAKGMLSVEKRKVELLEAEIKAPGRECAHVVDARTRFNRR